MKVLPEYDEVEGKNNDLGGLKINILLISIIDKKEHERLYKKRYVGSKKKLRAKRDNERGEKCGCISLRR